MLATIRLDAPIEFSLPKEEWKKNIDAEKTLSLFSELGFRTLSARMRQLLALEGGEVVGGGSDSAIPATDLAEGASLLWLLESDRGNPSYEDIIDYGRSVFNTTDWTDIKKHLVDEVKRQGLWEVYEQIDKPLLPVIARMNEVGIKLDVEYLQKLSVAYRKELGELEAKIHDYAGEVFNINSPKQLGVIIYDKLGLKPKKQKKTAGGARSTRESELSQLSGEHPIIDAVLRWRELSKLVSTYVDSLPKLVREDGRLRTTFLPCGTATGRVGSKDPNLQNIPVRTADGRAVRRGFIAEDGFVLVAIDYSQIELRIAAIMSGDKKMIEIFKDGQDVHSAVASQVFGVAESEVTADMRRRAKVINFGILYGMGVVALRANLGDDTTREAAQEFLNAYFNTFTRLAEYLEETKAFAREHGYTKTMFGRRRHFPGITSSAPFIRASAERAAINAPIQGTEGDILRIAMVEIDKYIASEGWQNDVRMLLQVHDELVFEIKEDKLKEVVPELARLMSEVFKGHNTRGVPIAVEAKVGKNWEEMDKLSLG